MRFVFVSTCIHIKNACVKEYRAPDLQTASSSQADSNVFMSLDMMIVCALNHFIDLSDIR